MATSGHQVTQLLHRWRDGDSVALESLLPLVYAELRRLASRYLASERAGHTLQPTALVHEAYLRMLEGADRPWQDRVHFYAVAAQLMRRILVDHARARGAAKRGGGAVMVPLDEARARAEDGATDVLALDQALSDLESIDPRKSRIIELRYFGGLTIDQVAELLELSAPTIVKETRLARAWIHRQISAEPPEDGR